MPKQWSLGAFFDVLIFEKNHLDILMQLCGNELSYGVERNIAVDSLSDYFEINHANYNEDNDDETSIIIDSREKANKVLRVLKNTGWIEEEIGKNRTYKINFLDYALTIYKSFAEVVKNEEMEYQSVISLIYNTLRNEEAYKKPYGYVLKNVKETGCFFNMKLNGFPSKNERK